MAALTPATRLRTAIRRRRDRQACIDAMAQSQVTADETALSGRKGKARDLTLAGAGRAFWSHPSPFILAAMVVVTVTWRAAVGDWQPSDLIVPAIMAAAFPFVEWVIHVFILHLKPATIAGRSFDPLLAREHRAHHADPRDLPLVFIPWPTYVWLVPILAAIGLLAFPRLGLGLTYLATLSIFGFIYEWTHYLIHSDYRPRRALYKAVWRNHRLHHYKNENYWFSVTTSGISDRVLGTYPDPKSTPNSPTVKDLLASFDS